MLLEHEYLLCWKGLLALDCLLYWEGMAMLECCLHWEGLAMLTCLLRWEGLDEGESWLLAEPEGAVLLGPASGCLLRWGD